MHCICLWAQKRNGWLGLYLAAFCVVLGCLVLPTQIDVEDTVGKYLTCVVVAVLCLWSIGVCMCLYRRKLRLPYLQPILLCCSSLSAVSMVGCWGATALPLTYNEYLSVSSGSH
jgi:hypothetical protein